MSRPSENYFTAIMKRNVCWLILCLLSFTAPALAQSLTPEQLQQLQELSPTQRQQLLEVLGSGAASSAGRSEQSSPQPVVPASDTATVAPGKEEAARFSPRDFLVVEMQVENGEESKLLDDVRRSLGRNVYQLGPDGRLEFPGAGYVLLSGLTEQEVELRLSAVPALRNVDLVVSRLPVTPTGNASLTAFGYDLFQKAPTTFAPVTDIPVPEGYTLGVGDELSLSIFGQHNANYNLMVGRDGGIDVPEIGPVQVAGMSFVQAREELAKRVASRYIGVDISLTLGELKSIRIFVLGDVNQPGSYTVSGLSTMTNALLVSGGVAKNGSLRNIQLKRSNRVVGKLDLYDLLLHGNTKGDRRLNPGDVIFVPPVANQVSVFGQVTRPAIYELSNEKTVDDVIQLAGGLLATAYQQQVRIEKFDVSGTKSVVVADLRSSSQTQVRAGDQIEILRALDQVKDAVYLKGHVDRETTFQWRPGLRLLDVIPNAESFRLQADQNYLLIRRFDERTGQVQLITANWLAARGFPAGPDNVAVEKGDTVHVFSLGTDRAIRIKPLVDELRMQANNGNPLTTVSAYGRVQAPGEYPYYEGMRVNDLLRASGGAREYAYLNAAELTRTEFSGGQLSTKHIAITLNSVAPGSPEDIVLSPGDILTVKEIQLTRERQRVEVVGEVKFPGSYRVSRGERLSEVIVRAGGLTDMAFVNGSIFLRSDLRQREREQLDHLTRRMRAEVNAIGPERAESRARAQALLEQLEQSEAVGRLVIDLSLVMQGDPEHDVVLESGDKLVVPTISQEVTVIGEVQYPTSHIYDDQLAQFDYINRSGGVTRSADAKRIYVIRADGQVIAQQTSNWFRRSGSAIEPRPGDTIVVPVDADSISNLSLWTSVTGIIYNIGIAAAAVASF